MLTHEQINKLRAKEAVPNRLKAAMEIATITQVQLASAVGITQSYVSEIANGNYSTSGLPLNTARKLAECFGCTTDDLFPVRETQDEQVAS